VGRLGSYIRSKVGLGILAILLLPPPGLAQQDNRLELERLVRGNHLVEAEQQLRGVLQADPGKGWALDLLGSIRMRQKRNAEAEALFQRAFSLKQSDVQALRGLGDVARASGNLDKAIDWYTKLLVIVPADIAARKALAMLQEREGHHQESLNAIQAIPLASRTPDLLPVLASDYLALRQEAKIGPLIRDVLRLPPAASGVTLDFVAVLVKNGYLQDAEKLLQAVRPARPNAEYLHLQARVIEAQGQLPQAWELLQQALKLEPKSFELLFDCARFAAQHERWSEAVDFLHRADQLSPDRPEVLLKLTLALLKSKRREAAVVIAKRLNSIAPDDPDAQYILAFSLVENELWEMADPIAVKALQARPGDANTLLLMAIVHINKGDIAAARKELDGSLAVEPHLADAHYYSALVSERMGDNDAARKELTELIQAAPNHAGAQAELGVLDLRAGNVQSARAALETAVRLEPDVAQSHYQLGLVYARLGLQDEAKVEMDRFQKLRTSEDSLRRREAGVQVPR